MMTKHMRIRLCLDWLLMLLLLQLLLTLQRWSSAIHMQCVILMMAIPCTRVMFCLDLLLLLLLLMQGRSLCMRLVCLIIRGRMRPSALV